MDFRKRAEAQALELIALKNTVKQLNGQLTHSEKKAKHIQKYQGVDSLVPSIIGRLEEVDVEKLNVRDLNAINCSIKDLRDLRAKVNG